MIPLSNCVLAELGSAQFRCCILACFRYSERCSFLFPFTVLLSAPTWVVYGSTIRHWHLQNPAILRKCNPRRSNILDRRMYKVLAISFVPGIRSRGEYISPSITNLYSHTSILDTLWYDLRPVHGHHRTLVQTQERARFGLYCHWVINRRNRVSYRFSTSNQYCRVCHHENRV